MKKNDPANYRRNSEPFPKVEQANEALAAFFEDVKIAREKHRISDEEELRGSASSFLGDHARVLPMLAREFGAAQLRAEVAFCPWRR